MSDHIATKKLIEYLRIKSVHPDPDYESAVKFIREYANEIGFDSYTEVEVHPNRIVCLMTYLGKSPDKPAILLNSHYDVVPCDEKYWKCDPFEAKMYENGDIYARGIQDMKSVGILHMEVIRRMKEANVRPERTIYVTFVPDEELGGLTGFVPFMKSNEFKSLKIGVALDEGQVSPTEEFGVYNCERMPWWLQVTVRGNTGHASRFIEKTAAEKLQRVLNKMLAYREEQKTKLKTNCNCMMLGDVNTVNLTKLGGGLAQNIVPAEFTALFDLRLTTTTDPKEFENMIVKWLEEAEEGEADSGKITHEFLFNKYDHPVTPIGDDSPWWKSIKNSTDEIGINVNPQIFPGGTDTRFLREIGIPGFGFTPFNNTPILLHDHNEFLNVNTFIRGLDIMYKVVLDLANVN